MIKRQVNWQTDKFTFSADGSKNGVYQQLRAEFKELFKNGWEVISQQAIGYDPSTSDVVVVVGLAKYEYDEEPISEALKIQSGMKVSEEKESPNRGRPAKK